MLSLRHGETITKTSLIVDGQRFVRCTFVDCQLIYEATIAADFDDCTFHDCTWTFDGAAERTITYLATLATKTGPYGRKLVDGVFKSVLNRRVLEIRDEAHITTQEDGSVEKSLAS